MKAYDPKRAAWAGLLASGLTITSGLVISLFVVMAFSNAPRRDLAIVAVVFTAIIMIPVMAMRPPKNRAEKKPPGWWRFWRRRKLRERELRIQSWKRKRGQGHHKPFGTRESPRPSTFVARPRKPTEP